MKVSVVIPVLNEKCYIQKLVESLAGQETQFKKLSISTIRVLLVDGGSSDGTLDLVKDLQISYKSAIDIFLLNNKNQKTPFALNIGIEQSVDSDFIVIVGARSVLEKNYIVCCIDKIIENDLVACSGRLVSSSLGHRWIESAISNVVNSSFGTSSSSVKNGKPGISKHLPRPVFRREVFDVVGRYNEKYSRNQDNEFNSRVWETFPRKMMVTGETQCLYFPKLTLPSFLRASYIGGRWVGSHHAGLRLHNWVPLFFVSYICMLLLSLMLGVFESYFLSPLGLYFLCSLLFSCPFSRGSAVYNMLLMPFIFSCLHVCYGFGTLTGLFQWLVDRNIRDVE